MKRIEQAFMNVPRREFIPRALQANSEIDAPLPIGFGQTNSQPTTVRLMLEWLAPLPGNKVLDVGSGSGWTSALLAYIVGPKGRVYAVERIPELVSFGRKNVGRVKLNNVSFYEAKETIGLPGNAPFDRILVSAAAQKLPEALLEQLKTGGKMVIPVKNDVLEIEKKSDTKLSKRAHQGFVFVPLLN